MNNLLLAAIILLSACSGPNPNPIKRAKVRRAEAYSTDGYVQMVVEIPAGINHWYSYDEVKKRIVIRQKEGEDELINFLPMPGNYGFIPHTQDSEGHPLQALLLSESLPLGAIEEIIPIGGLLLKENGAVKTLLLAVPVDSTKRIIQATDFATFLVEYDAAKRIIEEWFTHYKGSMQTAELGWRNEIYCISLIEKMAKKK